MRWFIFLIFSVICGFISIPCRTEKALCPKGTIEKADSGQCLKTSSPCEFGLDVCPDPNEECLPMNNRNKNGGCVCVEGFDRNSSGNCVETAGTIMASDQPTALAVTISGPKTVLAHVKEVNLTATVQNVTQSAKYAWSVKEIIAKEKVSKGGSSVALDGADEKTVRLRNLITGNYTVHVLVTDGNMTGGAEFVLSVVPEKRKNQSPVAVIQPPVEHAKENTQIILDGSGSSDRDGKIAKYVWTQVNGPLVKIDGATENVLSSTPTLTLSQLKPGNYTFKLTVTDDGGSENSTMARIFVEEEIDYPPKAFAGACNNSTLGGDLSVRLPISVLFLCGNRSTDDKKIIKWKWSMKDSSKNVADMEGTSSPILKISNLHAGDYTFNLVVEDEKQQTSSAEVHVVVLPADNKAPIARAGQNQTIRFPQSSLILDGSLSSDDGQIVSYSWSQIKGPSNAQLSNEDKARMTASDMRPGVYGFELNVTDDGGLSSADTVYVTVDASDNRPPVPVAADVTLFLPCNVAVLNASGSTDDAGVVRWLWSQHDSSPAGLDLLGTSWQQPVLYVSGFSVGTYTLNLTVFDQQGAFGSKLVKLYVLAGIEENEQIELYSSVKFAYFTVKQKRKFAKQVQAVLEMGPGWERVNVNVTKVTENTADGNLRVLFYCTASVGDRIELLHASTVAKFLETHGLQSEFLNEFSIKTVDSLYCQNNCSGRGRCENYTKRCSCDRYWMPNLFAWYARGSPKDCDWSVLYCILVVSLLVASVFFLLWFVFRVRDFKFRCPKTRRLRRYRMLNDESPKNRAMDLKPLKSRNGHALHGSDSDSTSDEETVYDRSSLLPKNQHSPQEKEFRKSNFTNGVQA